LENARGNYELDTVGGKYANGEILEPEVDHRLDLAVLSTLMTRRCILGGDT
jgi:hypothetical protein